MSFTDKNILKTGRNLALIAIVTSTIALAPAAHAGSGTNYGSNNEFNIEEAEFDVNKKYGGDANAKATGGNGYGYGGEGGEGGNGYGGAGGESESRSTSTSNNNVNLDHDVAAHNAPAIAPNGVADCISRYGFNVGTVPLTLGFAYQGNKQVLLENKETGAIFTPTDLALQSPTVRGEMLDGMSGSDKKLAMCIADEFSRSSEIEKLQHAHTIARITHEHNMNRESHDAGSTTIEHITGHAYTAEVEPNYGKAGYKAATTAKKHGWKDGDYTSIDMFQDLFAPEQ